MSAAPLLAVEGLAVRIERGDRVVRAVSDVSFEIARGQCVGLVGESGCGKSMTALALLGLLPPGGRITEGRIRLAAPAAGPGAGEPASARGDGAMDLARASEPALVRVRGRRVAMVFQDAAASLTPWIPIGEQIAEGPRRHLGLSRRAARECALEWLRVVGMPDAAARLRAFPHELSGGQRQRVLLAVALASEPELLVADEPTTALDVTLQAQVLALLARLRAERGLAVLLVSHDLSVIEHCCERVVVLYAGRVVEAGPTPAVLAAPEHPYTAALLRALPRLDGPRRARLDGIAGLPPALDGPAEPGCAFAPRCARAEPACAASEPALVRLDGARVHRCRLAPAAAEPPVRDGEDGA